MSEQTERLTSCSGMRFVGIKLTNRSFANFSQMFQQNLMVFYRCDARLGEQEIAYFGEAQPPETGPILELKCPELQELSERGNGTMRVTMLC